ncbi:DNA translocase FtsK [Bartonella acomydis]|uniref:FtsK gamma domain-containing protein n=1 Tax=Bartonella acomydis TaxID=686234 RepID=A0ABP9MGC4_9HYPH
MWQAFVRDRKEEVDVSLISVSLDNLYNQAVVLVFHDRKASTSYVQRCLGIG